MTVPLLLLLVSYMALSPADQRAAPGGDGGRLGRGAHVSLRALRDVSRPGGRGERVGGATVPPGSSIIAGSKKQRAAPPYPQSAICYFILMRRYLKSPGCGVGHWLLAHSPLALVQ